MYKIKTIVNGKEKSFTVTSPLREGDTIEKMDGKYCIVRRNISKYKIDGPEDWKR